MGIFKKDSIAIQISDRLISILIGNKKRIRHSNTIELKEGLCVDGVIVNEKEVAKLVTDYFRSNKVSVKKVSFIISESHIISRQIELPKMKADVLREEVYFEFNEFIPNINDYYIDYEIIQNSKNDKTLKILLVATTKDKVDSLVKLCEEINVKLDSVDIISNSFTRVFHYGKLIEYFESIGIFYLGFNSSTFSVIESGMLKLDRTLPFGVSNLIKDDNLIEGLSIKNMTIEKMIDSSERGKVSFENLILSISKTIQFYNSERKNSKIEKIILISPVKLGKVIEEQISHAFNISTIIVKEPSDLGLKIKCNDFSNFVGNYGLFLRRC